MSFMPSEIFLILAISLLLTLLLEVPFAFLFGARDVRGLVLVVLTNCVTNPPVVLLYTLFPSFPLKIVLEIIVVLTEWLIYKHCADFTRRPFGFALSINAFSYLTGEVINHLLPLLF